MRKVTGMVCTDCHAIAGEDCINLHRPVRAKLSVVGYSIKKPHGRKKVKLWKLKDPETRRNCQDRLARSLGACSGDMEELEKNLR